MTPLRLRAWEWHMLEQRPPSFREVYEVRGTRAAYCTRLAAQHKTPPPVAAPNANPAARSAGAEFSCAHCGWGPGAEMGTRNRNPRP
jgi:hypothetical protein